MAKKMLIDATHSEETRVVVVDGNKVEEFDFESENKRQLAGNIYLAKVSRVEPSLQAAFVDYGGNRHGFLAFSEIHPDYYQIPVADREALMEEERAYAEAMRARDEEEAKPKRKSRRSRTKASRARDNDAVATSEVVGAEISGMETIDLSAETDDVIAEAFAAPEPVEQAVKAESDAAITEDVPLQEPEGASTAETETPTEPVAGEMPPKATSEEEEEAPETLEVVEQAEVSQDTAPVKNETEDTELAVDEESEEESEEDEIESVADEDDSEDIRPPRKPRPRRYKIQEVIKVRQILLVQVVKEERGNKGAALTTYLSLAGRYCVLMPNTARGGGISRKITNVADRKKIKEIASEIDVPQGAGLIVRTAGAKRTKAEIKRDYEYLQRLWEQIRELTLKSIAPAKIYEEGDLIKRSIRDLYNREIDEVLVEGERGYRNAKDFMKMIMPSHAKHVQQYTESLPLFARYQVESYLGAMFNPTVQLASGGYIVIGVTEALVAVDVNSGRATKEGSIEETALKTNLEAAEEVARQVRLRDLAGLIVIDFIDMEERKNNTAVEKRLKDKLKTDRARIQVGRISGFGLLEMSRQRLRPGMIEATTQPCPHCHGTGLIRSDDNMALSILRQIEEEGTRRRSGEVLVKCPVGISNYIMNVKREHIAQIEARYGLSVRIEGDPLLISPDFTLEKFKTATRIVVPTETAVVSADVSLMDEIESDDEEEDATTAEVETEEDVKPKRRRRRRRRRKPGSGDEGAQEETAQDETASEEETSEEEALSESTAQEEAAQEEQEPPKPRRRRRSKVKSEETEGAAEETGEAEAKPEKPKRRRTRKKTVEKLAETTAAEEGEGASSEVAQADDTPQEEGAVRAEPAASEGIVESPAPEAEPVLEQEPAQADAPQDNSADEGESAAQSVEPELVEPELVGAPPLLSDSEIAPAEVETFAEPVPFVEPQPEPELVGAAEPVSEPAPAKPKRRGWWSLGNR
jgi:ribonuclease E